MSNALSVIDQLAKPARHLVMQNKCKFFCVYRTYNESISKEMNNDNDSNLHSWTKLSGWFWRYRYTSIPYKQ